MPEQLEDLEIDRVDGVDDPATKRRFALLKSATREEIGAELEAIGNATETALKLLSKSAYDRKTARALAKVADLMEFDDIEFRIRKEADAPPAAAAAPAAQAPAAPAAAAPAPAAAAADPNAAIVQAIKAAFAEGMEGIRKSLESLPAQVAKCLGDGPNEPETPPDGTTEEVATPEPDVAPKAKAARSSQPRETRHVRKAHPQFGAGMFADVIYGPGNVSRLG